MNLFKHVVPNRAESSKLGTGAEMSGVERLPMPVVRLRSVDTLRSR
jgi:hypothetical protein